MSSLREIAESRSISVGTCVNYSTWKDDGDYRNLISEEFNMLTPENCLKWSFIHPEKEEFDFEKADELVEFARENEMGVTGHTLVWHMQNPEWLGEENFESEEVERIMKNHIMEVVSHYSGEVEAWDVVNEAVNDEAELRESIWLKAMGEEYIEKAFREASKHCDAKLFYNDYGLIYDTEKREKVHQLLSDLLDKGVPIDGIGLQSHFIGVHPTSEEISNTIEKFQDLGLEVRMTELDVAYEKGKAPEKLEEKQTEYYRKIFQAYLENGVKHLCLWGLRDSDSWINTFQDYDEKYSDRPLLFGENGDRKKSYEEVKDSIKELN